MAGPLDFERWKDLLCTDCARTGKLEAFRLLDELVLRLFYECGIAPTVDAITTNPALVSRKPA
jgi:hypothetical protein